MKRKEYGEYILNIIKSLLTPQKMNSEFQNNKPYYALRFSKGHRLKQDAVYFKNIRQF